MLWFAHARLLWFCLMQVDWGIRDTYAIGISIGLFSGCKLVLAVLRQTHFPLSHLSLGLQPWLMYVYPLCCLLIRHRIISLILAYTFPTVIVVAYMSRAGSCIHIVSKNVYLMSFILDARQQVLTIVVYSVYFVCLTSCMYCIASTLWLVDCSCSLSEPVCIGSLV